MQAKLTTNVGKELNLQWLILNDKLLLEVRKLLLLKAVFKRKNKLKKLFFEIYLLVFILHFIFYFQFPTGSERNFLENVI